MCNSTVIAYFSCPVLELFLKIICGHHQKYLSSWTRANEYLGVLLKKYIEPPRDLFTFLGRLGGDVEAERHLALEGVGHTDHSCV